MSGRRTNSCRRNSLDLAPAPYMTRQAGAYTPPASADAILLETGDTLLLESGDRLLLE